MISKLVLGRRQWFERKVWPLDLYKLALALFLFLSPWWFAFAYSAARIEAWCIGLSLMVLSVAAMITFVVWEEWLALALGLWLIAAPWLFHLQPTATKIHIGVGLLVTYLAGLELWLVRYDTPTQ